MFFDVVNMKDVQAKTASYYTMWMAWSAYIDVQNAFSPLLLFKYPAL